MKKLLLIITMLPLIAGAQGVKVPFGTSNPSNSNWCQANFFLNGLMFMPAYAGEDTTVMVVLPDGSTMAIPKTSFGGGSGGSQDLQQVLDNGNESATTLKITESSVVTNEYTASGITHTNAFTGSTVNLYFPTTSSSYDITLPYRGGILATDLESALENGNVASTPIIITGGSENVIIAPGAGLSVEDNYNNVSAALLFDGTRGNLKLAGSDPTFNIAVVADDPSDNYTQTLQAKNGVIATLDDITGAMPTVQEVLTQGRTTTDSMVYDQGGAFHPNIVISGYSQSIYTAGGYYPVGPLQGFNLNRNGTLKLGSVNMPNGSVTLLTQGTPVSFYDTFRNSGGVLVTLDTIRGTGFLATQKCVSDTAFKIDLSRVLRNGATTTITGTWQDVGAGYTTQVKTMGVSVSQGTSTTNHYPGSFTASNTSISASAGLNAQGIFFGDFSGNSLYIHAIVPSGTKTATFTDKGGTIFSGTFGNATLSSGTVTVSNTNVAGGSVVTCVYKTPSGTLGTAFQVSVSAGVGFTINAINTSGSTVTTDNSTIQYTIVY